MLWLPGRNDCFFHAHVANLLDEMGIDLYVLNYRRVGECRCALACCLHPEPPLTGGARSCTQTYAWLTWHRWLLKFPAMRNSHCASGRFSEYHSDIAHAIQAIKRRDPAYAQVDSTRQSVTV